MSTPKQNFLKLVFNDDPHWLGDPFNCFNCSPLPPFLPFYLDAAGLSHNRVTKGGVGAPDAWGVIWDWPADQPGPTPDNSSEEKRVIKDITRWKEFFDYPDLDNLDWTDSLKMADGAARENKIVMVQSPRGMFEHSHAMMGFEYALESYMLEPDDMYDFMSAYTDWKIKGAGLSIDKMKPDIMVNFSDWGAKHQMFLPPRVWREILKPHYDRFFKYIKSRGVIVMNHCDCYAADVCEDMVEMGIDIWQGATPENNIPNVIERTGGKLFIWGGVDMPGIDYPGVTEDVIRAHFRDILDKNAPTKRFLPMYSSWLPVYPGVKEIGCDEMEKYGAVVAKRVFG